MIFMIILTVLTLSSMNNSVMEQKITANEQYAMEAFESAQSVVDATLDSPGSIKVLSDTNVRICYPASVSSSDASCTQTYDLSARFSSIDGDNNAFSSKITGKIIRLDPETLPAPRGLETSADKYDVALFEIEGTFNNSAEGYGRSTVGQGYIVLVPKSGQ